MSQGLESSVRTGGWERRHMTSPGRSGTVSPRMSRNQSEKTKAEGRWSLSTAASGTAKVWPGEENLVTHVYLETTRPLQMDGIRAIREPGSGWDFILRMKDWG